MEQKQKLGLFAVALVIVITAIFLGFKFKEVVFRADKVVSKPTSQETVGPTMQKIYDSKPEMKCQEGWREYSQDVLGIAFCYPKEWDKPEIQPYYEITDLGIIANKNEFTAYKDYIEISFLDYVGSPAHVDLKIFNDNYKGEEYGAAQTEGIGKYVDNIPSLRESNDICKYNLSFNHGDFNLSEIENQCASGVKTVLTDEYRNYDFIGKWLHNYNIKSYAFLKLANGYFDNVLISKFYDSKQTETEHKSIGSVLSETRIGKDEYFAEKNEFEIFVKSIRSYKPILQKQQEFREVPGEDPNITAIRKYYWLIESGKLDEAFAMRSKSEKNAADDFKKDYADAYVAEPLDFKSLGENIYEFHVKYQDKNQPATEFRVKMKVDSRTLETFFIEEYMSEIARFGDMYAYSAQRGDRNYVILNKDGKEEYVDEGLGDYKENQENMIKIEYFSKVRFSESGKYLLYDRGGWEYIGLIIYDIANAKQLKEIGYPTNYGFSADEKYFFMCTSAGIATGPDGKIYSMPDFKEKYDLLADKRTENFMDVDCSLQKNAVKFDLSSYAASGEAVDQEKTESIEVDLETMLAK